MSTDPDEFIKVVNNEADRIYQRLEKLRRDDLATRRVWLISLIIILSVLLLVIMNKIDQMKKSNETGACLEHTIQKN